MINAFIFTWTVELEIPVLKKDETTNDHKICRVPSISNHMFVMADQHEKIGLIDRLPSILPIMHISICYI